MNVGYSGRLLVLVVVAWGRSDTPVEAAWSEIEFSSDWRDATWIVEAADIATRPFRCCWLR